MATIAKITKTAVDQMTIDPDRPTYLWDSSMPGFGVKCSPRGVKRYVVKYRSHGGGRNAKQRWLILGGHGALTPDQARKMAQQSLAAVARNEDPQGVKGDRRKAPTVSELWARFEKERLPARKPQTRYDYQALWTGLLKPRFGKTAVPDVGRGEIDRFHKALRDTPYRANRALALLSRLMTLAEAWELRSAGTNPCRHVERFKEEPRARYLKADERKALGIAMVEMVKQGELAEPAANAIRLLLLTGARLSEILAARWEWVHYDQKIIALPDSKTGRKPLYLSDPAIGVLRAQKRLAGKSEFVFPGLGKQGRMINLRKPWIAVCDKAGLSGVRLHDLRHTAASVAVGEGASLPIIGRLLGHTQAQTTLRYAHVDSDPALVAANAIGKVMMAELKLPPKAERYKVGFKAKRKSP